MKKIHSFVPVVLLSVPVSLGAVAGACGGYESSDNTGGTGNGGSGGGDPGTGGNTGRPFAGPLPGEILQSAGLQCVTAHSTVRAVIPGYAGPLYQLCKGSSVPGPSACTGTPQDIGLRPEAAFNRPRINRRLGYGLTQSH